MSFEQELADIHAAFAGAVLYTGGGLSAASVSAVPFEDPAPDFQGAGRSARRRWYEIEQGSLPDRPARGDLIVDGVNSWSVIEVVLRDDIGAYELSVERSAS